MKFKTSSLAKRNIERFVSNKMAVVGLIIITVMLVMCIFAPLFTHYDPALIDVKQRYLGVSSQHIRGTDSLGRDIFARLLYGGRWSILIGISGAVGSCALGAVLGCISGYFGGTTDKILLTVSELFSVVPSTLIVLLAVGYLGRSVSNMIFVFMFTGWTGIYRVVRSRILSLKNEPFVESCIVNGISGASIMFKQMLPNTLGPIIVNTTLAAAGYILEEAGLSFLGMGVPPEVPTWGNIINAAKRLDLIMKYPHLWVAPGIAISLFVLGINFFGDGLRDVFDVTQ